MHLLPKELWAVASSTGVQGEVDTHEGRQMGGSNLLFHLVARLVHAAVSVERQR